MQEIGESARKILCNDIFNTGSKIEWAKIVSFRNFVVHEYFGIEPKIIFDVVRIEIPDLRKKVLGCISKIEEKKYLFEVIDDSIEFMNKINRQETVVYLEKLKKYVW